jgi:hypothetical protein
LYPFLSLSLRERGIKVLEEREYAAREPWNWDYPEIGFEIWKNTPASWGVQILHINWGCTAGP